MSRKTIRRGRTVKEAVEAGTCYSLVSMDGPQAYLDFPQAETPAEALALGRLNFKIPKGQTFRISRRLTYEGPACGQYEWCGTITA
jgi:hypothetical protein